MGRGIVLAIVRAAFVLLAVVSPPGCSQVPPQAGEHGRALTAYHDQTATATLAAIDHLAEGLETTLDRVRETTDDDWAASIADSTDAAQRFDRLRAAAVAGLSTDDPGRMREQLTLIRDDATASSTTFQAYAATAAQTRAADLRGLLEFQRAAAKAAAELRSAIADRNAVLSRELERQGELLESVVAVQDAQHALLGARASAKADHLRAEATDLAKPIAAAAARLDAAIRLLRGP